MELNKLEKTLAGISAAGLMFTVISGASANYPRPFNDYELGALGITTLSSALAVGEMYARKFIECLRASRIHPQAGNR